MKNINWKKKIWWEKKNTTWKNKNMKSGKKKLKL